MSTQMEGFIKTSIRGDSFGQCSQIPRPPLEVGIQSKADFPMLGIIEITSLAHDEMDRLTARLNGLCEKLSPLYLPSSCDPAPKEFACAEPSAITGLRQLIARMQEAGRTIDDLYASLRI